MKNIFLFVLFLALASFAEDAFAENSVAPANVESMDKNEGTSELTSAPDEIDNPKSSANQVEETLAPSDASADEAAVAEAEKVAEPENEQVEPASIQNSPEQISVQQETSVQLAAVEGAVQSSEKVAEKKGGLLDALYPVDPDEAIAKGRIYGGASLSLIQGNTDNDPLNILIGDVYDAYGYTFTVEAFGGYFIKDAMAIGLRAGYSRTWFDIDFSLMEDLVDLAEHRKYVSNGFFVQPVLKNYLKVLNSRNFYFFNETSFSVEYSYGVSQSDDGEDMKKSRNRGWSFELGINPGICIMVLNRFAFETSVGLLGLSSSVMEVEENGKTHSEFVYNIVNFTINLLALDFSLVYFF